MIGVPEGCCTKNIGVPRVLVFATFLKRHVEIGREYPGAGGGGVRDYAGWFFRVYMHVPVRLLEGILHLWMGGMVAHSLGWG